MENQKLIANKFNQALGAMQTGFTTTNEAFQKVQDAVNNNAQALSKLASELSNTFGAISASIGDILVPRGSGGSGGSGGLEVLFQGPLTQINTTLLDLTYEMLSLQQVVKALNESYIDLKELLEHHHHHH
uniref:HR1 of S protein, LINKER, HR2 of S protein n=1 Tax=Human betacoronavirus 2c (isolate EMC/2012) TaxID=1235996 RepID=UPI0003AFF9F2|nr:Chain A, HR1 of S protein, LINKER, HR2 of S protein [synthetic construct]4MOD_B Chain B, HR1 of S protein, LINKER, HR2 of S protein [synthetic construct]